jgi:regulator-associated protein of mTOR
MFLRKRKDYCEKENQRRSFVLKINVYLYWVYDKVSHSNCADLFQRLFRQDLLVASLFRNFLLAERIMRSANCSPISYPLLPPTHQHHMW